MKDVRNIEALVEQKRVAVAVCSMTDTQALLLACEPMRSTNRLLDRPAYELVFVADTLEPVRGQYGIVIKPTATYDEIEDHFDLIIIAAKWATDSDSYAKRYSWLTKHAEADTCLCGVEGGAVTLAEANLLDGYRAVLPSEYVPQIRAQHTSISLIDELYAIDRNRTTCGGGMIVHDLALAMVENDHGAETIRFVQAELIAQPTRRPDAKGLLLRDQITTTASATMLEADALMKANIQRPLSIPELANQLKVSVRQLQLLSRKTYQETLSNRYLDIRLRSAQELLMQSDKSISEIVEVTGFKSTSTFSRAFRRRVGMSAVEFKKGFGRSGSQPFTQT